MTADQWNRQHPPGTRVRYYPVAGQPAYVDTRTRGLAWALSTGTAVVALEGVRGSAYLRQLQLIDAAPVAA